MGVCKVGTSFFCVAFGILHVYHPEIRNTLTVRQKIRRRKKQMRERDENAYIRFFALWFAAGMTLGVLLLLAASHTGMKEGNSVRLFQAEAFFGRKISAKACFSYLLKVRLAPAFAGLLFGLTAIGAYFATAAVWAYGFLCGVFLSAAYLQNGMAGLLFFFPGSFSADFPLPCRVISDGCCVQPDGRDESPCRRHTEKGIFLLRRALLLCTDPASVGYSA